MSTVLLLKGTFLCCAPKGVNTNEQFATVINICLRIQTVLPILYYNLTDEHFNEMSDVRQTDIFLRVYSSDQ